MSSMSHPAGSPRTHATIRTAPATTILSVTGTNDTPLVLTENMAAAVAFALPKAEQNLSFSVTTNSIGGSAVAYLSAALDAAYTEADLIAAQAVVAGPLFSGIDLAAGTYFLTIANATGVLEWAGASAPVTSGIAGAGGIALLIARDPLAIAPGSRFDFAAAATPVFYAVTQPAV